MSDDVTRGGEESLEEEALKADEPAEVLHDEPAGAQDGEAADPANPVEANEGGVIPKSQVRRCA